MQDEEGFSLREEMIKVLLRHHVDHARQIVDEMQPWIVQWATTIVGSALTASYIEGLVHGWGANLPDTIPSEEDR